MLTVDACFPVYTRKCPIFFSSWLSRNTEGAVCAGLDLLLVFRILNGLVSPFPVLVLAPEFWLVLFPLSVFVLAQQ